MGVLTLNEDLCLLCQYNALNKADKNSYFVFGSQVLPSLMKSLAQLVVKLHSSAQDMILNELYQHVAESDDVTRKPTLVSWLQSLSYLSYQNTSKKTPKGAAKEIHDSMSGTTDSLSMNRISARL